MVKSLLSSACLSLLLLGCDSGADSDSGNQESNGNSSKIAVLEGSFSINEFKSIVKEDSGFNSNYCGETQIEEETVLVNRCVKDSFENNEQFYSFYRIQGENSTLAAAVMMNASGIIRYWDYDSGPPILDISEAFVSHAYVSECDNPEVKLNLNKYEMKVFNCSNLIFKN